MNTKSWKSTVGAAVSTLMLLAFFMQTNGFVMLPKWAMGIIGFAMAGGFAYWGVNTKDADLTGGDRGAPAALAAIGKGPDPPAVPPLAPAPIYSAEASRVFDSMLGNSPNIQVIDLRPDANGSPAGTFKVSAITVDRAAAIAAYRQRLTIGVK